MKKVRIHEKWAGVICIALGLGGIWLGWPQLQHSAVLEREPDQKEPSERLTCNVLTVYDGDTLGCDLNQDGEIQKPQEEIRLLGIDSPEMHYSRKNKTYGSEHPQDEPFAKEASQWLTAQAHGKRVFLILDIRPNDKYGRTLAYVFPSNSSQKSYNEQLLETGYATLLLIGPNRRFESQFTQAEAEARKSKKGLWGTNHP